MAACEVQLLIESIFKFSIHEYAIKKKSLKIPFLGYIFLLDKFSMFQKICIFGLHYFVNILVDYEIDKLHRLFPSQS